MHAKAALQLLQLFCAEFGWVRMAAAIDAIDTDAVAGAKSGLDERVGRQAG